MSDFLKQKFIAVNWGGSALISLYISVVSGIIVALQYTPSEPFYSTSAIELIVPYGSFWRAMHYYSSQVFLFLLIFHFIAVVWENSHLYERDKWVRLTLSIPVTLLLLFTGYMLRDDATGEAAGLIAENIALSIPLIGKWLNGFFLAVTTSGLKRVYAHHLAGLMVIGAYCVWPHLRRYSTRWRLHLPLICLILLLSVLLVTPMEPQRIGLLHIAGPWFFLGLQELLRYIHPFWAGIVFPGILVVTLLYLPHEKGKKRKVYLGLIGLWLLVNSILTWVSYLRI
ncbi:MAG: cytochrome b N-terminal domain-containing protein [Desulfobulbaceae bacterium]|nr:cytochrome b N-terminal domain-containing protein [Desulfobulbaceae bacterium]